MKKISWAEIKKQKYMVIKNKVYDVKDFSQDHPGGAFIIDEYLGKDATEAFLQVRHSTRADEILETLYVGELDIESEKVADGIDWGWVGVLVVVSSVCVGVGLHLYYK
ncbi:hypothetical protein EDEG_02337 [Edhazardia aedis USNM 41457]|uniref:Cytochrome b5 heme-binding domain-containing protein n=1 Tax=Edhazardia aedis (strain USNM 41457) TaxID=1003232 RepID=J9D717_EDHAE|nr:hypothetical protein EDEG_02337 [Edhazardia aedis USNM 41457]|eukprot:EJW03329.1 hypothetical protein EDEG_02337 [Edhazardia aedis USNM 41457]